MLNDILSTNYFEVLIVIKRAIFSLVTLFVVTNIIGRKQVSELSLFDYVISISIGNFAAEMTMNLDSQVLNGFVAMVIFGLIATFVSILTMKSIIARRFFIGSPTIIIQDGKFIYKNLKRTKFDINDFLQTCRISGYFDVSNIKYALMEANGKISFLPKEDYAPVINKDMKLKTSKQGLCANLVIDGKVLYNNLKLVNKDISWLLNILKVRGYENLDDILLVTIDINSNVTIFDKKNLNKVDTFLE